MQVSPHQLIPNPQYAKYNSDKIQLASEYERIKDSMITHGIDYPLIAIKDSNILVCGHKRRTIAIELGLETVPVMYESMDVEASIDRMVEDNLSRTPLEKDPMIITNIITVAKRIYGITHGGNRTDKGTTLNDLSKKIGISTSRIREYARLTDLTPDLQAMVSKGMISVRAGSNLSTLPVEAQDWFYASHKEATEIRDSEVTAAIMLWKYKEREIERVQSIGLDQDHDDDLQEEEIGSYETQEAKRNEERLGGSVVDIERKPSMERVMKKSAILDFNDEVMQERYRENLVDLKLKQAETTIKRLRSEFEVLMQEHSNKFDTPRTYWHSQLDKYVQTVEEFAGVVLSYKQDVSELEKIVYDRGDEDEQ